MHASLEFALKIPISSIRRSGIRLLLPPIISPIAGAQGGHNSVSQYHIDDLFVHLAFTRVARDVTVLNSSNVPTGGNFGEAPLVLADYCK